MKILIVCLLVLPSSFAFFFGGGPDWDGLKVTWGLNPFSKWTFAKIPRTESDARSKGWKLDSTKTSCTGSFLGNRYILDGDTSVMPLYGPNGYIVGIQNGIPKNLPDYPTKQLMKYWSSEAKMFVITAYFYEPAKICAGRDKANFNKYGTGQSLWLQTGSDSYSLIPYKESEIATTKWTKGKCFWTMGQHYWYNLRQDMSCDEFVPVFLLYNKGILNGFGWAMRADLKSNRYEHPTPSVTNKFMDPPPKCILDYKGVISTMHVYMTDSPSRQTC